MAKNFLRKGANINVKDNNGWTPLHEATLNGHKQLVDLLIKNGADINAEVGHWGTPLSVALSSGKQEVAAILRRYGGKE
jgi:ankyrin repeat protein